MDEDETCDPKRHLAQVAIRLFGMIERLARDGQLVVSKEEMLDDSIHHLEHLARAIGIESAAELQAEMSAILDSASGGLH